MWLINVNSLELKEFVGDTPGYAILSHTWDEEEVTFQEMSRGLGRKKKGYRKIQLTCEQAVKDNIDWAWVDTCCIDKKSSSELSEAINSMFHWYENATVCYTYLADVLLEEATSTYRLFRACRWITRGWTLQELLAPRDMIFYDSQWNVIGNKFDLASTLERVTNIYKKYIDTTLPLTSATVAEKMSWAQSRKTTREEDSAYCLLGIFGVNMPLLYGERGQGAFMRLQQEIFNNKYDPTIFGAFLKESTIASLPLDGPICKVKIPLEILGLEALHYGEGDLLEMNPGWPDLAGDAPTLQSGTIRATVPIIELTSGAFVNKVKIKEPVVLALFGFRWRGWGGDTLGLVLRRWGDSLYCRNQGDCALAVRIPVPDIDYLKSHTKTIYIKKKPLSDPETQTEILLGKNLLKFPSEFQLQTLVLVPPTTYDLRTRWLLNISEREGVIFALIYSNPSGYRFALVFAKQDQADIMVRPYNLTRLLPDEESTSDSTHSSQEDDDASDRSHQSNDDRSRRSIEDDRSRRSIEDGPRGHQYGVPEIVEVVKYKLESYIQELGATSAGPDRDEPYDYLICPVVLRITKKLKVNIYIKGVRARDPDDNRIDSLGISCSSAASNALPNWNTDFSYAETETESEREGDSE